MRHLYVHVPFCPVICPYCDFHVLRRTKNSVNRYLDYLKKEATLLYNKQPYFLNTLYIGGGTPSFLRDKELETLFSSLPWRYAHKPEITLEINPGTVTRGRLEFFRSLGVNRLSIGVQSFNDNLLRFLGRSHNAATAKRTVEEAMSLGFSVSIDLILALPEQDARAELKTATALGVDHVSAYTLQIEPGTPFALRRLATSQDNEASAFALALEILGDAGLLRYEVSNYARPGSESRHNLAYWRMDSWGGLGPSAAAHFFSSGEKIISRRTTNPPLPRWLAGEPPETVELGPLDYVKESLMMGLRTRAGVDLITLEKRSGLELRRTLARAISSLGEAGLIKLTGSLLTPSNAGLDRLHEVVLRLWEPLEASYSSDFS